MDRFNLLLSVALFSCDATHTIALSRNGRSRCSWWAVSSAGRCTKGKCCSMRDRNVLSSVSVSASGGVSHPVKATGVDTTTPGLCGSVHVTLSGLMSTSPLSCGSLSGATASRDGSALPKLRACAGRPAWGPREEPVSGTGRDSSLSIRPSSLSSSWAIRTFASCFWHMMRRRTESDGWHAFLWLWHRWHPGPSIRATHLHLALKHAAHARPYGAE